MNIHQLALTMINGVGSITARQLLESLGSAEAVFSENPRLLERIPGIGETTASAIKDSDALLKAEQELKFIEKNNIKCIFIEDKDYPKRLKECNDAPLVLYYKGNADLNAKHIISIVGTRKISDYGRNLTENLIQGISEKFPDTLIISGLAYGVDVCAHRNALKCGLPTVGVLAHGLDRIYPAVHRQTAIEMLDKGGLLTDFPSDTNPDRANFLKRNRIVAGISEATIVVESADKGGSLVTADLAVSYSRDVYTFPGRTTDYNSKGCNNLIRKNKAGLITSAEDLIESLGWETTFKQKETSLQTCFDFGLTEEQEAVLKVLCNEGEMHINSLSISLSMPVHKISSILFELEMNGKVRALPGNVYKYS